MRCRRCGEDNIPGLVVCLACGQDLAADPSDEVIATRPRVRAANPLARPRRPPRPRRLRLRLADEGLVRTGRILSGLAAGLLVGLGPWRRGDRRTAALFWGAAVACVAAWFAPWTSALQPLAWMGLLSVLATSGLVEVRHRTPTTSMQHSAATTLFAVSMALGIHLVATFAFDTLFPRVVLPDTGALRGGAFLVERVEPGELAIHDLVAIGPRPRLWQVAGDLVRVGPVVALAGQQVEVVDGEVRVDGEPSPVRVLNPVARPRLRGGEPLEVPDGMVAVLVDPITVVRPENLLGRLFYRWTPAAERGPLQWPPPQPAPEPP